MLKPASSLCNLRCRYCFYCDLADLREVRSFRHHDGRDHAECSAEPGSEAFRREIRLRSSLRAASRCWQGLGFYPGALQPGRTAGTQAFRFPSRCRRTGMPSRPRLVRVLKERRVLVGLSYDMLEDLHDGARVDASSRGTNRRVLESMRLCKKPAWSLTSSARSQIPSRAIRKRSGGAWSTLTMCALCSLRRVWMRWKHRAKASMR